MSFLGFFGRLFSRRDQQMTLPAPAAPARTPLTPEERQRRRRVRIPRAQRAVVAAQVVAYRDRGQLPFAEIAKILGISPSFVSDLYREGVSAKNGQGAAQQALPLQEAAPVEARPRPNSILSTVGRRPQEAQMIREANERALRIGPEAFSLSQAGKSLTQIARILDERGVPTVRGGNWSSSSVKELLLRYRALKAEKGEAI